VTLKRHLTVVVTFVMALTMAGFAWLLVRTTRAELTSQLSNAVVGAARDVRRPAPRQGGAVQSPAATPQSAGAPGGRRVARLLFEANGDLVDYQASGFPDQPDPRVQLPTIGSTEQQRMVDRLVVSPSVDGTIRYLVMTRVVQSDRVRFDAISMESADSAVRRLTLFAILSGALATLAASLVTAFTMRRTLRPVEEMVTISERIASGNLTARTTPTRPNSEIGRLGTALNSMLATIEGAIADRDDKELELRQFIADASHELRTPITVVQGYSDLYRQGALGTRADLDKAMERIESQTARMSRLVTDLLLLANLERPDFITREPTDVTLLATESISEFELVTDGYEVTMKSSGPAIADVDGERIRQVFDNLLRNVSEHTKPGTTVHIDVSSTDEAVTVKVIDSGPGIASEDCKHLFQRFWRADPANRLAAGSSSRS
jgi:two-component system, OmpR family, sensor kinase